MDIIGLEAAERSRAHVETIAEFPNGYPDEPRLLHLFKQIENLYGNTEFAVIWLNNGNYVYLKVANKQDVAKIACLWERISGNYLMFLPHDAVIDKGRVVDEEEFIGVCLKRHKQMVLKTEDAYVVLFLQLFSADAGNRVEV